MKRLHIHIAVENLEQSMRFYSALFGAEPSKVKSDYAKWMLEDPCVNFAISARGAKPGLDHLGLQAGDASEMAALRERIQKADMQSFDEGETACCYARSDKSWVKDPNGIAWETYHTMADVEFFNEAPTAEAACCVPKPEPEASSCAPKSGCC